MLLVQTSKTYKPKLRDAMKMNMTCTVVKPIKSSALAEIVHDALCREIRLLEIVPMSSADRSSYWSSILILCLSCMVYLRYNRIFV